jgi:large subunit ribosomal protein L7e
MTSNAKQSDLPLVPEAILKRRHDLDEVKLRSSACAIVKGKTKRFSSQKAIYVKKPETILARARSRRNSQTRYRRVMEKGMQKRASNKSVMGKKLLEIDEISLKEICFQANSVGAPFVCVIRIRDDCSGTPSEVQRALSRLRLRNLHDGVFVRYDTSHRKLLHLVEPYVVYGQPSNATVHDLLQRRGFGKLDGKRVALSNNTIIEEAFAETTGLLCVEDLVHELCSVGEHFKKVSTFLWPFRLSHPKSKFEQEKLNGNQMKQEDYGDKGQTIDEVIAAML